MAALTRAAWSRHFVYRRERLATTWKFRVVALLIIAGGLYISRGWWTVALGRSLVCAADAQPSDAALLENFDADYLLFERATDLRRKGLARRVFVPVRRDGKSTPNAVALGTAKVMASIAHLDPFEVVPIREVEPISLNAAYDLLSVLQRERIRSVIVVAPYFRSRRSAMIYRAAFGRAGIAVTCEPVRGLVDIHSWPQTTHGIQGVVEQWIKLQYYRLYVLPFRAPA